MHGALSFFGMVWSGLVRGIFVLVCFNGQKSSRDAQAGRPISETLVVRLRALNRAYFLACAERVYPFDLLRLPGLGPALELPQPSRDRCC